MEDELAAVTVPPSRKAGFSCGIFSERALAGCSSVVMRLSPARDLTVTGATSASKAPLSIAASAFDNDPSA
jgi:hypothetical protein